MAQTGPYLDESLDDNITQRHIFCPRTDAGTRNRTDMPVCGHGSHAGNPRSRAPICPECLKAAGQITKLHKQLTEGK